MKDTEIFDIAVVGAGPAGLIAACTAAGNGARVILFEKNNNCGLKLLITGSGACNITNKSTVDASLFLDNYFENGKFLFPALSNLSPESLLKIFTNKGVEFIVREDNKVFPSSLDSRDILDVLLEYCNEYNVVIKTGTDIDNIKLNPEYNVISDNFKAGMSSKKINTTGRCKSKKFILSAKENSWISDKVIVTTGGLSYPSTGSTGSGYIFGRQFSHCITQTRPALVGLKINDQNNFGNLSGISLRNVKVSLFEVNFEGRKNKIKSYTGDLLITHVGVSGPCALYLSRYLPDDLSSGNSITAESSYFLSINFRDGYDISQTDALLVNLINNNPKKNIVNLISSGCNIPNAFVKFILAQINSDSNLIACNLTKINRKMIAATLHTVIIHISETEGYKKAMVTAGGVSNKEINPKTMESKLESGLYFAGEVIDIDGFTGGYNLQAAFSTGYLAGTSAAKEL